MQGTRGKRALKVLVPFAMRHGGSVPEAMASVVQLLLDSGAKVDLLAEQALGSSVPLPKIEITNSAMATCLERAGEYDLIWTCSEFLLRVLSCERATTRSIPLIFTPARRIISGAEIITQVLREAHPSCRTDLISLIPSLGRGTHFVIDEDVSSVQHIRFLASVANLARLVVTPDTLLGEKLLECGVSSVPLPTGSWSEALEALCATAGVAAECSPFEGVDFALTESPLSALLDSTHRTPAERSNAPVEILVPIYNAPCETRACLEAVYQNTDRPFSLILIDDRSTDPESPALLDEVARWERPTEMRRLIIIRNERNLGFAASMNRALALTTGDVVLLNNDTVPPSAWLSRLEAALASSADIASATPWSNNGTICSIPAPCEVNPFPTPEEVTEVQRILEQFSTVRPPTIPTGVGFCMLVARRALDRIGFFDSDTFRPMYGEENDWCARAAGAGLRNVLAPSLYVPHHPSASLSTLQSPNQAARIKHMVDLVDLFHPHYRRTIADFIELDPLRELRQLIEVRKSATSETPLEVTICNLRLGGGSHLFLEQRLKQEHESKQRYILDLSEPAFVLLDRLHPSSPINLPLELSNAKGISALLDWLGVTRIFINHLIGFALGEVSSLLLEGSRSYEIVLHDYYAACPGITLLRYDNSYCGGERDSRRCNACLALGTSARVPLPANDRRLPIEVWRTQFAAILAKASRVHTCSEEQRELLSRYFPQQHFEQVDFSYLERPDLTFQDEFAFRNPPTVAVIGAIGQHKGSDIVYWLEEAIRRRTLNIRLVVIGYTDREQEPRVSHQGRFVLTGRYKPEELPELLARYETACTLFPSIWPETYLITVAEAHNAGYPAIVFDVGAPAARVRATGGGWVVSAPYGVETFNLIQELARSPRAIIKEAAILRSRRPTA